MQKTIEHKELGTIVFRKNARSRQYTIRLRRGQVSVSLPMRGSYQEALQLVEKYKGTLLKKQEKSTFTPASKDQEKELRQKARYFLPARLSQLASLHRFDYTAVRITKSKTRWGSCSSKKSISLSIYLMLLSEHLIDYVLLHELCHTRQMNHGPDFWSLMEMVCNGNAKALRRELRNHRIPG